MVYVRRRFHGEWAAKGEKLHMIPALLGQTQPVVGVLFADGIEWFSPEDVFESYADIPGDVFDAIEREKHDSCRQMPLFGQLSWI